MDDTRLTVAAWGKSLGISRQAAHAAAKRLGVEVIDGRVHGAKATAVYRALTRVRVKKHPAAEAGGSAEITYSEAKRRTAVAEALMAERNERQQAGELGKVAVFEEAAARQAVAVREHVLSFAARLSGLIAHKSEPEAYRLLYDEAFTLLGRISNTGDAHDGRA